jgi:hypothetical protein
VLSDRASHRLVKVPHQLAELEERLRRIGWDIAVSSSGPFYWGTGTRSRPVPCDNLLMTERLEVQQAVAASPGEIFAVLKDPRGHVAIDSSGMLMEASG